MKGRRVEGLLIAVIGIGIFSPPLQVKMLTPPFHFAIPACPPISPSGPFNNIASPSDGCSGPVINLSLEDDPPSRPASSCILYRGAIPAARNIPFIRRLRIKTVVALTPFLPDKCPLSRWAQKDGADVRWVKADKMGEEKLGMGKSEVSEVLKVSFCCCGAMGLFVYKI